MTGSVNLPRLMERPSCIALLLFLYSLAQSLSQVNHGSCNSTIHLHHYLAIYESSPPNSLLYVQLKVIALYSQEHKGNCAHTECIGSHFNKIGTPLVMLVHFYRTGIKMHVNWLKKRLTLQTNKWWGSTKAGQIILIEDTFHLGVKVCPSVTTFILQLHLDVALELIKFCENGYYRDLKNHTCQFNS